jgi:hypothetical protein
MALLGWFTAALLLTLPASAGPLTLRSNGAAFTIDPSNLAMYVTLADGRSVPISAAQKELGEARELFSDATSGHWKLRGGAVAVSVSVKPSVKNAQASVRFEADGASRFTWPFYGTPDESVSYILPKAEGLLMEPRDAIWRTVAWPRELDTLETFSLPLWGVMGKGWTITYLMTNPFDNTMSFRDTERGLSWSVAHEFNRLWRKKEFGYDIIVGPESPVEPARQFRRRLMEAGQFVSMKHKISRTPEADKLPGAAHVYLWTLGVLGRDDVKDWKALARTLAASNDPFVIAIRQRIGGSAELKQIAETGKPGAWQKREILAVLGQAIREPADRRRVFAAFPGAFAPVEQWGDGVSAKQFDRFRSKGLDRLWLGISSLDQVQGQADAVEAARNRGYLIGPYDSYDSIHAPGTKDTWETAQFDAELYEKGSIAGPDGSKPFGFQKKGHWLSSIAARPYVERRVGRTFADFPFNSFFMDCDATGDMRDNYAPAFLATKADDMRERLSRMQWVVDRYKTPIGSEDGWWFAAPVIHFAHGMMTPYFGWGDARLQNKSSPYYLGGYWPPDAPAIFFKKVAAPEDYRAIYYNPRVRIPLFQTVFHDSVVTTHHWTRPSLKFSNATRVNELLELLYNVPPLYHLNPEEWDNQAEAIARHYRFFSPLHRKSAMLPMSGFAWLTADRLVQKTWFGGEIEMIANFGAEPYLYGQIRIPGYAIAARFPESGAVEVYVP